MNNSNATEEEILDWVIENLPEEVDTSRAQGAQPFDGILSLLDEAASAGLLPRTVKQRPMEKFPDPADRELFEFYPVMN